MDAEGVGGSWLRRGPASSVPNNGRGGEGWIRNLAIEYGPAEQRIADEKPCACVWVREKGEGEGEREQERGGCEMARERNG